MSLGLQEKRAGDSTVAQRKDAAALGRAGGTGTRVRRDRAVGRGNKGCRGQRSARDLQELAAGPKDDDVAGRLRGQGAGREALTEHDAGLVAALERLVDPTTRDDPTGPLRWTCSNAGRLSRELEEVGHRVSERSLNRLLHERWVTDLSSCSVRQRSSSTPSTNGTPARTKRSRCAPFNRRHTAAPCPTACRLSEAPWCTSRPPFVTRCLASGSGRAEACQPDGHSRPTRQASFCRK